LRTQPRALLSGFLMCSMHAWVVPALYLTLPSFLVQCHGMELHHAEGVALPLSQWEGVRAPEALGEPDAEAQSLPARVAAAVGEGGPLRDGEGANILLERADVACRAIDRLLLLRNLRSVSPSILRRLPPRSSVLLPPPLASPSSSSSISLCRGCKFNHHQYFKCS
jgi:hypothetical protein